MAIDTISGYFPKMTLPVYTKIVRPRQNDYTVGNTYEIRVEDSDRAEERDGKPPYNYVHEALLVSRDKRKFGEVPDLLLAFDAHAKSREDALQRICPGEGVWGDDVEVYILTFLRKDKAKEYITSDTEFVPNDFSKEDTEDN